MYPARSNFRSNDPGSAWFFARLAGDAQPRVVLSNWNTFVKTFQRRAVPMLPERFFVDPGISVCQNLTDDQLINKPGRRYREDLKETGRMDAVTFEALFTLLCKAGMNSDAQAVWVDSKKKPGDALSPTTVRALVWIGSIVHGTDLTKPQPFSDVDLASGSSIQFPKDVILPLVNSYDPAPDVRDANWVIGYRPGLDQLPMPPSVAVSAPKSNTANVVLGLAFLGTIGFVGYKLLANDDGGGARRNPSPRRNRAAGSAEAEASDRYTELHAGLPPDSIEYDEIEKPKYLVTLGEMPHIQYKKRLFENGKVVHPDYKHPFAAHARPILAHDEKGRLHIVGGNYTTTARGVEDLPPPRRTK